MITLGRFRNRSAGTGTSAHTIVGHTRDVRLAVEWSDQTNDRANSPAFIAPIDVREYRGHLLAVENH
jgi:hypothetical protein